jgi:hypothetical protein
MGIHIVYEFVRELDDGSHPSIRGLTIKRERKLHKIGEAMGYPN